MTAVRRLVLALGCLLVLSGCGGPEGTGDKGYISGDGVIVQIAAADRGEPVELAGETLEGDRLDLADLRGEVVVVNTWWSQCPPCRVEMPMLADLSRQLEDAEVVGINIRDTRQEQGLRFMETVDADFPSLWSPDGKALLAFSGKVNLQAVPSTVVLDRQGRAAAIISGEIPGEVSMRDLIEEVAAEDG